jgi:hypothetical protein
MGGDHSGRWHSLKPGNVSAAERLLVDGKSVYDDPMF